MLKRKLFLIILAVFLLTFLLIFAGCAGGDGDDDGNGGDDDAQLDGENEQPNFIFVSSAEKPEGCAGCHTGEYALENDLPEGHPKVNEGTAVKDCTLCHSSDLGMITHEDHLTGGSENNYIANYGGVCNHCHKLTAAGNMIVKGLEEKGTEFIVYEEAVIENPKEGCTDCHSGEHALEKELPEGHPQVEEGATIDSCLICHSNDLDRISHLSHYEGGEDNHFRNYGSSCNNCHEQNNGDIAVKEALR